MVCARLRPQRNSPYTFEWRGRLHVDRKCFLRLGSNAVRGTRTHDSALAISAPSTRAAQLFTQLHTTRCGATYGAAQDLSRE